jgi:hypothetical protein
MAGTIPLSLTQQLDEYGAPLSGGQLYVIQAGTISTPQNPYQDTALSIVMPNPITLDAAGRIPQFFLADGQIKVRLQDKNGVVKFQQDNLLVIGPSAGGGGGGGSVDPTTVWQTGDIKIRYDNLIIAGFVRLNGKTIGASASTGSELADASAQALFLYLWNKDSTLVVTPGGRGASAAADWAANKAIALPDGRNRLLMALADMGNSDVGLLASNTFTKGNQVTLGSMLGVARLQLGVSQMANHYHGCALIDPGHYHTSSTYHNNGVGGGSTFVLYNAVAFDSAGGSVNQPINTDAKTTGIYVSSSTNGTNTTYSNGGGAAFDSANPIMLITVYMKL